MKTYVIRPSGWYWVKLFVLALPLSVMVSMPVILLGMILLFGGWTWAAVALLFALYLVGKLVVVTLVYRSLRYEINASEVVVYAGVLTKTVKHVPFRTVTNLQITRSPIDRLLGLGSLDIQTAGMSGSALPEERLVGLANVQKVYEYIAGELRRFQSALSPAQAGDDGRGSLADDRRLLWAILEELRAIRARVERA